jgi:hypothetical protein
MIAIIVSGVFNPGSVQFAFLQRVLVSEWDWLEWPFQMLPVQHGLLSHVWLAARRHA